MFRRLRNRFSEIVRKLEGHKVRGEFGDPNASPRPRKEIQNLPHRIFTTDKNANVNGGDVISWRGIRYLLLDQHTMAQTKKFLAAELPYTVVWTRSTKTIDPVSRVEKSGVPTTLNPALPVAMEPRSSIEEEGFENVKYRIFTGADVQKGDMLDDWVVKEVHQLFGVKMLEVI